MRALALLPVFLCATATAQNWALLNPTYKYNYSNDGSDTITNQIFVTHIDTLGVDSFRYELNKVAELCDTCAGPGYYLWTNGAQFLQRKVNIGPDIWHFNDPGSFVILPGASLGSTWLYDTLANVEATVASIDTVDQFGTNTARKTIGFSNGGTMIISETNGVLSWAGHELIGVHGPDVGSLIPSLAEFFPYQPGDAVQYFSHYLTCSPCAGTQSEYKFVFSASQDLDTAIHFSGWYVGYTNTYYSDWTNTYYDYEYTDEASAWTAGSPDLPSFDIVHSYPGQLVGPLEVPSGPWGIPIYAVAKHSIDSLGRYQIRCDAVVEPNNFIVTWPTDTSGLVLFAVAFHTWQGGLPYGNVYTKGVGFEYFRSSSFDAFDEYYLTATLIAGDTAGTLLTDDQLLTIQDGGLTRRRLIHPNPASDLLFITPGIVGPFAWRILSTSGAPVLAGEARTMDHGSVNVDALRAGAYLVEVVTSAGVFRERLIIAR